MQVYVPFNERYEYVKEFKQAHRRDDDIAIVNAGMRFRLRQGPTGAWAIGQAWVAYGGVAPKSIMAPAVAAALAGRPIDPATLDSALAAVNEDVRMSPNAPGGMVEFRRSLAASFLFKGLLFAAQQLEADAPTAYQVAFPPSVHSAVQPYHRPPSHGLQYYSQVGVEWVLQPGRCLGGHGWVVGCFFPCGWLVGWGGVLLLAGGMGVPS